MSSECTLAKIVDLKKGTKKGNKDNKKCEMVGEESERRDHIGHDYRAWKTGK